MYQSIDKFHQFLFVIINEISGSTRIMVLTGPPSDSEKEWEYSPTEMRKMRERQKLEEKLRKEAEKEMLAEKTTDDEGISWGMGQLLYSSYYFYSFPYEGGFNY